MDIKKFLAPIVGISVVDDLSAAKIRFAQCCGESFKFNLNCKRNHGKK